ncbi:uncharacterized protein LOC108106196 [Drosophila eugracilis]|uniref:uncharacterized protein LOC108106196 n=1 Tax=Drosophila eugracilis TaxID=29029 RepID=UPI0007E5DD8A|nr:uncharacterized protein LOC108106196 [Drosophila eugracilis]
MMSGILLLLALLAFVANGAAIKCFVCDSSDNPSCSDLDSNSSIVAEECTLDKMKSLDTWLLDLNKFAYFDNGGNKKPLMNCEKVVAKDPETRKVVTARFCQLDTGDSNACQILRDKLRIPSAEELEQRNRNQNKRRKNGNGDDSEEISAEDAFFCEVCNTDSCNGAAANTLWVASVLSLIMILLGC